MEAVGHWTGQQVYQFQGGPAEVGRAGRPLKKTVCREGVWNKYGCTRKGIEGGGSKIAKKAQYHRV